MGLHSVSPASIQRKDHLTTAISAALSAPVPDAAALRVLVDELDALEPAFTAYDRLRFGGPTSRDTCIDAVISLLPGW